ncbi:MAG: hypothetical protein WAO21_04085 [Verrucomicrobiia bacterium]|jgi:hypothetical protein
MVTIIMLQSGQPSSHLIALLVAAFGVTMPFERKPAFSEEEPEIKDYELNMVVLG